jgi:hypothetical protein
MLSQKLERETSLLADVDVVVCGDDILRLDIVFGEVADDVYENIMGRWEILQAIRLGMLCVEPATEVVPFLGYECGVEGCEEGIGAVQRCIVNELLVDFEDFETFVWGTCVRF